MQLFIGTAEVDARFEVEPEDGAQTVLFRSRGGGEPVRNAEYNEGLVLLLRRLADLNAVLDAAVVDSADTRRDGVPFADRLLDPGQGRSYPLALAAESDFEGLRLALGRNQVPVGRPSDARGSGNYTKQIRLFVTFPDPAPSDSKLERALAFGTRILVVALPRSARKNLEWGLENGIWGFPVPRFAATEAGRVRDYKALSRGDKVLVLSGYTGGSPRSPVDVWTSSANGDAHRFDDCYLCTVNQPYYVDMTPFWPNEDQSKPSRYPHRIGIDPLSIGAVSLQAGGDVSADVIDAVRRSHLQGAQGFMADAAGSKIIGVLSTSVTQPAGTLDETPQGRIGQGRSVDPVRRKRVEDRAVALARARYEGDGWLVTDVSRYNDETYGTPYDLRCSKEGVIRHVEVKGAGNSGETVRVSANERAHAGAPNGNAQSFLFVVEQIGLKTVKGEVKAFGGVVRYDGPFLVEDSRFTATQYRYVVPGSDVDGGLTADAAADAAAS
jgi:hypothetical protein